MYILLIVLVFSWFRGIAVSRLMTANDWDFQVPQLTVLVLSRSRGFAACGSRLTIPQLTLLVFSRFRGFAVPRRVTYFAGFAVHAHGGVNDSRFSGSTDFQVSHLTSLVFSRFRGS